jgi:hypothetical protein
MYVGLHLKYFLFLSGFNKKSNFIEEFSKKFGISNFMEIRPVRAELFHAEGQTDRQA